MKLYDLNDEQLHMLKQNFLMLSQGHTSWDDLAHADDKVSMEDLENLYGDTEFTEDDFCYTDERASYSY